MHYALIIMVFVALGMCDGAFVTLVVPAVSLATKQTESGAAYSFVGVAINMSFVLVPLIGAAIIGEDLKQGYRNYSLLMVGISMAGVCLASVMKSQQEWRGVVDREMGDEQEQAKVTDTGR